MRRLKIKLEPPEKEELEKKYRSEKEVRIKMRLLCVKLAVEGKHSGEEIGAICGSSRASIFEWIGSFRERGIEGLQRGKPGPPNGEMRGISEARVSLVIKVQLVILFTNL